MQGFFNTGGRRESEPSRPKFVNPRTGKEQSWQRASNFAAPLESPFGLIKHQTRQLIRGLNRRLDLARMLLTGAVEGEKVDEVIGTALSAAEDEAKANNGTAVHAALGLCDTGRRMPKEYWPHAQGYVAELKRWGLRPVAVEQRALNTRLGAMGTFDRIYVTDSGRYLVGDLKTGNLERAAHKFGVQLEVYAGSDYIVHPNDTVEPIPWKLDQDSALIIHVDPETGATSIYEVPLRIARWGAALAEAVRAYQRTDILLPYSGAPTGPLAEELRREAVHEARTPAQIGQEADEHNRAQAFGHEQATEASTQIPGKPVPLVPTTAGAAPVTPSGVAAPASAQPASSSTTMTSGAPAASPSEQVSAEDRTAELMRPKNDKATLQRMLHDLGGRDLAHNRKWLVAKIIEIEQTNAGARAARPSGSSEAEVQQAPASAAVLATTIEQGVPAAETTPFLLKQISEAATLEDIERLRANILRRSGPEAWSVAMAEVAQARSVELGRAAEPTAPNMLGEIQLAQSTQDLARIWNRVTGEGATPSAWTAELDAAAKQRGAELQAAQPPNPNPWGSA